MKSIGELFGTIEKKKAPTSERAYWIQEAANMTGMKFIVIFGKFSHLGKGQEATDIIKWCYLDSLKAEGQTEGEKIKWRRIRFWGNVKKTKPDLRQLAP